MPGLAATIRTSVAISRRSSGSPPVRRTLSTPSDRNTSTSALISSKCSTSSRGSHDVVVLRHAVFAAQVAAIGDRQPQVLQRPSEERHSSVKEEL